MLWLLGHLYHSREFWRRSSSWGDGWYLWEVLLCNSRSWVFYGFWTKEVLGLKWCQNGLRFRGGYWLKENSYKHFAKRSWYFPQSLVSSAILFRANQFRSVFTDLGVFSQVPFSIEPMMPKWTLVRVSKMVSMTVGALEWVGTWISLLCFQSRQIDFGVGLAAPPEFSMMFQFVRSIAFDIFGSLNPTRKCSMVPFPAVFTLRHAGIHVGSLDGCDVIAYIEAPVD